MIKNCIYQLLVEGIKQTWKIIVNVKQCQTLEIRPILDPCQMSNNKKQKCAKNQLSCQLYELYFLNGILLLFFRYIFSNFIQKSFYDFQVQTFF